jgi:hypothetical protein
MAGFPGPVSRRHHGRLRVQLFPCPGTARAGARAQAPLAFRRRKRSNGVFPPLRTLRPCQVPAPARHTDPLGASDLAHSRRAAVDPQFSSDIDMDDNQFIIPPSFVQLFIPEGKTRPSEPRAVIARRYDFCEDLAQMLMDTAREKLFDLSVTENEVLVRIHSGLEADSTLLSAAEAVWVVTRLAELLSWPLPEAWQAAFGPRERG